MGVGSLAGDAVGADAAVREEAAAAETDGPRARRPSLAKHIDRAIERLARLGGRLDWPESLQRAVQTALDSLTVIRDAAKTRGSDRAALAERLRVVDADLLRIARAALDAAAREAVRAEAVAAKTGDAVGGLLNATL